LFQKADLNTRGQSLWRYFEALGITDPKHIVSLGEGYTPLLPDELFGQSVLLKMDQLCPTGSFKDRGSTVMLSKLKEWGITQLIEDSSGNAGASVAAYATRAGIQADVYIPAYTSAGKAAQIGLYGANLVKAPGSREDTAQAALAAAESIFYASHNWSPYFLNGLKTLAYELAEQLAWSAPDWVVAPLGGGSLILGLYLGWRDLVQAGYINKMPRLAAVQAANCAPVYQAWQQGLDDVPAIAKQATAAEGIAIAKPVKGKDILQALRASDGTVCTVTDEEVWSTLTLLGKHGIYVEPTAAAAPAAIKQLCSSGLITANDKVVVELSGMGLKATDKIVEQAKLGHFAPREL
ncbi:MAG TPA: threonine synthase, partial [Firmicutes bacterium]|nr:threonine synthase [Bacillota bacterium]